jgi:hypothetical protein
MSSPAVEVAMIEWDEGRRRLENLDLPPRQERVIRHVVDEIAAELERRLGQVYSLAELVRVYDESTAWCRDVAQLTTEHIWAHDLSIVQDAAFARFARNASDFRP